MMPTSDGIINHSRSFRTLTSGGRPVFGMEPGQRNLQTGLKPRLSLSAPLCNFLQSMKMATTTHKNDSPPHWRVTGGVQGWVVPDGKDPPLKAEAFFPLPRGDFHGRRPAELPGVVVGGPPTAAPPRRDEI